MTTHDNALELFAEAMAEALAGANPPTISYLDELKLPNLALARSVWYLLLSDLHDRLASRHNLPNPYNDKLTMTVWAVACQMMQESK